MSVAEVLSGTLIGFVGSAAIMWSWLTYASQGPLRDATAVTLLCTVWSLVRGYWIRRAFAKLGRERSVATARDQHAAAPTVATQPRNTR